MPVQGKAAGGNAGRPGQRRQRAGARRAGHRLAYTAAQQSGAQGGHVTIEDHRIGLQPHFIGAMHGAHSATLHVDALASRVEVELHTARLRQGLQVLNERVHAATDGPDAIHLDLRDQHQRGRRLPGRRAAVSGIAGKELAHARVAEMPSQAVPQAARGP